MSEVARVVAVGAKNLSPLPMVNHQGIELHVGVWELPQNHIVRPTYNDSRILNISQRNILMAKMLPQGHGVIHTIYASLP